MIFGILSLFLFRLGAEGTGKVRDDQRLPLQVPQSKDGADKDQKKVTITGQVNKSGAIPWVKGLTLMKAVAQAGGLTDLANTRKVKVIRKGKVTFHDLRDIKVKGNNPNIFPGDVIVVPERFF
ncbi:SLBB domain-containing protein [Verrucomicrobiaceae bacterium 227]